MISSRRNGSTSGRAFFFFFFGAKNTEAEGLFVWELNYIDKYQEMWPWRAAPGCLS